MQPNPNNNANGSVANASIPIVNKKDDKLSMMKDILKNFTKKWVINMGIKKINKENINLN